MSSAEILRIYGYPSVAIEDTRSLPKRSGIYYAVHRGRVVYVGKAKQMRARWSGANHDQKPVLLKMGGVRLYYRFAPEYKLKLEESIEIETFDPVLNIQKPDPAKYDRGLARLDRIARDVFWGAAVTLGVIGAGAIFILLSVDFSEKPAPPAPVPPHRSRLG